LRNKHLSPAKEGQFTLANIGQSHWLSKLKKNFTIILVTHILRQAIRLSDNAVFMYDGEIIEQGSPDVIFKNPKTDKLKEYLVEGN